MDDHNNVGMAGELGEKEALGYLRQRLPLLITPPPSCCSWMRHYFEARFTFIRSRYHHGTQEIDHRYGTVFTWQRRKKEPGLAG